MVIRHKLISVFHAKRLWINQSVHLGSKRKKICWYPLICSIIKTPLSSITTTLRKYEVLIFTWKNLNI